MWVASLEAKQSLLASEPGKSFTTAQDDDALDEFRTAERFDDWVQAWTRATEHRDAFTRAFVIANGQRPAGS